MPTIPNASAANASDGIDAMLFENSPMPMWMYDCETLAFVAVNEAAVRHYGYSREEFAAMTLADIRPTEDLGVLREDVSRSHGLTSPRLWRHRKKDGALITVEISANDLDFHGRPVRLVLVNDVTAREAAQTALRQTEDQLRHAQKMEAIGRLAGGVAHDFNNILTVIESYASLVEDSLDAGDQRREDVTEILRASQRASAITRQLLNMSRHSVAAPRPIKLDEVVAGIAPMLRRLLGEEIALVVNRGEVPPVRADAGQIEQVIMNLAVNARDAMPGGGRLTIETQIFEADDEDVVRGLRRGRYAVLAVSDTGVGMDREMQRRIFEPFFTTKDPGRGTGLGLSIVHGIVSQCGGTTTVYSEPGHGTTFRVHLPLCEDVAVTPVVRSHEAPSSLAAVTVLVVDDDQDVRVITSRVLRDAGCSVLEAASADEARRHCVSHDGAIDVAILDVVLPDGRGDELAGELRDLRPALEVMLTSGYAAGALAAGGAMPVHVLGKPFSPASLRAAVARALGRTKRESAPDAAPGAAVPRVLVADDDHTVRAMVTRVLHAAGYMVVAVASGAEGVRALADGTFDVVVSDVVMPDGDGIDLLRGVRRVDLDVPVILISGTPDLDSAVRAVEYGAFRYLIKPLDVEKFVRTVHHASRARALARLRRQALAMRGEHAAAVDRAGLEVRFEQAMDSAWMAYQPVVHAKTATLYGYEALLHSNEPAMADPQQIIEAATSLRMLPRLGRRIRSMCAAAIATCPDSVSLFVKLHPDDLDDIDLVDGDAPLSRLAQRVVLEVTERADARNSSHRFERLARLRELGFRVAVDDIAAGHAGLTSFAELTPEIIKIDMSLVRAVHMSTVKQRTIDALCRHCHEMGCLVLADGLESLGERDCLIELGCDLLQGDLIGRAGPHLRAP